MKNERQPVLEQEGRAEAALRKETVQTTVLCAASSGTAKTSGQIFARWENKQVLGWTGTHLTDNFFFFFFTHFLVIPVATITDKKTQAPSFKALSEQTLSAGERKTRTQTGSYFATYFATLAFLHNFLLTCSERGHCRPSTACLSGERDRSEQRGGEDTLIEISHL